MSVARLGVLYNGMKSCVEWNAQSSCEQYNVCRLDIYQHKPSSFSAIVIKFNEVHIDQHLHMRTQCVFELLMVRDGPQSLSSDIHFTRSHVRGAVTFLCICW